MALIRALATLATAALAAGCGTAQKPAESEANAHPPALYAVGSTVSGLRGGPVHLAAPPVAPLAGWLTPAAVPSPDGRHLAYNAWRELRRDDPALSWTDQGIESGDPLAIPSIRVYDAATRTDELLEEGAFSVAWRADGAVAYFKAAEPEYRAAVPYVGDVVVRESLHAAPEVWSTERGRYVIAGWAGTRLLAYREHEGEALDVLVFDGPERARVLAADSGLVAISPDGRQALVEQGPAHGRPAVRVLDIADGGERAALDLTSVDPAVGAVSYAGDWRDDLAVAPSASGLAVFRIGAGSIELEQALRVEGGAALAEPHFADSSGGRVTAWTTGPGGAAFLDCDRAVARCDRVSPLPAARGVHGFPAWRRPIFNPSRPR